MALLRFLLAAVCLVAGANAACNVNTAPLTLGSARVDGIDSDWAADDVYACVYENGDANAPNAATLSLKYSCEQETVFLLLQSFAHTLDPSGFSVIIDPAATPGNTTMLEMASTPVLLETKAPMQILGSSDNSDAFSPTYWQPTSLGLEGKFPLSKAVLATNVKVYIGYESNGAAATSGIQLTGIACPSPSATSSVTPTISDSPSGTPTVSITPSNSPTRSPSATRTSSTTASPTPSPSAVPCVIETPRWGHCGSNVTSAIDYTISILHRYDTGDFRINLEVDNTNNPNSGNIQGVFFNYRHSKPGGTHGCPALEEGDVSGNVQFFTKTSSCGAGCDMRSIDACKDQFDIGMRFASAGVGDLTSVEFTVSDLNRCLHVQSFMDFGVFATNAGSDGGTSKEVLINMCHQFPTLVEEDAVVKQPKQGNALQPL